ncbi:SPX domain-containing protein [Podospora fimiseda]|uniref:SPX domain-containing protein n=1 Tax=Podospora fimiseda TaxID=252190 RepID=A0AAN7H687_9PEZI|nr:SPX domain-containing protein [Podospora fimiseda]
MKYGEQFEKESVPQWSLHNIDYNSLKHHIKSHTTRDQASAITIPGHQDTALSKFEDGFYKELCSQHDRVGLFVGSKADEISRRLQHLTNQIHRLIVRCATSGQERTSLKRQRRFAKYEHELLRCGDDIRNLQRFVNAQIVAFRKILKKYRKWTGSSTLGSRFRDNVLSHPKSFTRRDFSQLQSQYDDLMETFRVASPADLGGLFSPPANSRQSRQQLSPTATVVAPETQQQPVTYWNEYDHGSEAGDNDRDGDNEYAIYIDPNQDHGFPGMKTLGALFANPVKKIGTWMSVRSRDSSETLDSSERGHLLPPPVTTNSSSLTYGSVNSARPYRSDSPSYFMIPPGGQDRTSALSSSLANTETDVEDESYRPSRRGSNTGYASSLEEFPAGYRSHYAALPSINDQRMTQYRDKMLFRGTWACYAVACVLMGICAVLISTGRHKKRLEVDAGVTLGIMTSLGLACAAICMTGSRVEKMSWLARLATWGMFAGVCAVNGVLLVLVVGNGAL